MELHSPVVKTSELNQAELNLEKTPTMEKIKKFGREFVSRIVEPLSTESAAEKMPDYQRQQTGISMAQAAINSTRY